MIPEQVWYNSNISFLFRFIKMNKKNVFVLIATVVACELAGVVGSLFTAPNVDSSWYTSLVRPSLSPPNWIFGPVWTTLFALMGVAAFLVWQSGWGRRNGKIALGVFVAQLVLNVLWSALFFGLHNPLFAFVEIIALWLAIAATIVLFYKISRSAAWLLVPYIAWVTFAAYLNLSFWQLN